MEFIRILFDELIEDNKNTNAMAPYHVINNDNKSKYEVCQEYDEFFKSRETRTFMNFFIFKLFLLILVFVDINHIHVKIF